MHISPYEKGNIFNKDPLRVRKLLLHKSEINKLAGQIKMKGYTLMPLKVYFKGSLVKVEIGLARGKKLYDKRQDIASGKMVRAFVPLSEMFGYSTDLRSRTQGRGNYSMFFDKYEQVPKNVQEKVLSAKAK